MRREIQKIGAVAGLLAITIVLTVRSAHEQPVAAANIQVSSAQFVKYIAEWSEPEGYFDSDNFISNETSYEHVTDELHARVRPGGVYLGVGPDQNFTYIVHTRPSLAVIIDIRRQNLLQHLLFKALFDQATSRADFLALLFARQKPHLRAGAALDEIVRAVRASVSDEQLFKNDLESVNSLLIGTYKIRLTEEDLGKIAYTYRTFWQQNLDLRFSSIGRDNAMQYPTFESLLLETDRGGHYQNYLASDELFDWMKKFEKENRLIPIVGDFGGTQAFQNVSKFLKDNGLQVSTFYTSNVEFYLFGTPGWTAFMKNVHALPVSDDSVFVRAYFPTFGRWHPQNVRGHRSTSLVHGIVPFLRDYDAGRIPTYWEVVDRAK